MSYSVAFPRSLPSSASASTSSASSPSGSPPVAYQSDAYPPPDTALHAPFGTKRHPSRHSAISFPESGIEIPLAAPLDNRPDARITIPHPYARLHAKKDSSKRRKIWNHVLEKQLFSPQELSVLSRLPSFSCATLSALSLDRPWAHPIDAPYTSHPSKRTSIAFTIICSDLGCIRSRSVALNLTAA